MLDDFLQMAVVRNDICRKISISSAEATAGTAGVNSIGILAENSVSPLNAGYICSPCRAR